MVVPVNRVWREIEVSLPDGEKSEQWISLFQNHFGLSKVRAVPLGVAGRAYWPLLTVFCKALSQS